MDPLFGFGPKLPKLNLEVLNGMTYSEKKRFISRKRNFGISRKPLGHPWAPVTEISRTHWHPGAPVSEVSLTP